MSSSTSSASAVFGVLRFLFSHWRRHLRFVVQIVAAIAVATTADVVQPILSGRLVDIVAGPGGARGARPAARIRAGGCCSWSC